MCAVFLCVCRDTDCLLDPEADKESDIYWLVSPDLFQNFGATESQIYLFSKSGIV